MADKTGEIKTTETKEVATNKVEINGDSSTHRTTLY